MTPMHISYRDDYYERRELEREEYVAMCSMRLRLFYPGPLTVHERTGERGFGGLSTHWCGNCGPVWTALDRTRCPHCGCRLGADDNHDYSFHAKRRYHISRQMAA